MASPSPPPPLRVLLRGLRARCPACGEGRVFLRGFRSERRCGACGWRLERGPGHWIGGAEINLVVAFPLGILACGLLSLVFGLTAWTAVLGAGATALVSLAIYRPSRALFFAMDYLIDPVADPATGGGDAWEFDGEDAGPPPRPAPRVRRRRRARGASAPT